MPAKVSFFHYERSGQASTSPSYTVTLPKLTSSEPSTMYPSLFEALYHDLGIVSQSSLKDRQMSIPNPGAEHESIVRPDLYYRVVHDDGDIEGLDLLIARRLQDVEQSQLSGLRACIDARGGGCRRTGV